MATTLTTNTKLKKPASGDPLWGTGCYNPNFDALDAMAPIGQMAVTLTEVPSTTLNVKVSGGKYISHDGTIGTYAGTASQAITTATTKVLYLDLAAAGVLVVAAAYPTTAHIRLATVIAGATTITSITDDRVTCEAIGTFSAGMNFSFDTVTGSKIGTATSQKLAFFNSTPIVQPTSTTDLRVALINLGLVATGGASPLDLNGGALTVGSATIADAGNVALNTTTGTKIGTATGQKLGFWNATPVIQPAAAGQATVAQTQTTLTDSTGGAVSTTLAAITAGAAYAQADMTATKNAIASLAAELALVKTDVANTLVLLLAIRTALVNSGIIKGSA
jgi:hypothetical protein